MFWSLSYVVSTELHKKTDFLETLPKFTANWVSLEWNEENLQAFIDTF